MRTGTSDDLKGVTFSILAGLLWLGAPPQAWASSLCPQFVTQPVVTSAQCFPFEGDPFPCGTAPACPTPLPDGVAFCTPGTVVNRTLPGFRLQNGVCTNSGSGGIDPSAFSGAALASQALSALSQTTTQETSRSTVSRIIDRREQEEQRCAEGFSRVDGTCERNPPPVREEVASVESEPGPPPSHKLKKAKTPKAAAIQPPPEPVPAGKIVRRQPLAPIPPPLPVGPAIRFATWTQVYGDYERRNASAPTFVTPDAGPPVPVDTSVRSRTGTVGFQVGGDFTSRGVLFADDGLIAGAMAGYVTSHLTLNTLSMSTNFAIVGNGSSHTTADLAGPMAGLYATYFNGGFSTDLFLKVDVLRLNETFTDNLAFTSAGFAPNGDFSPAFIVPFSGSGSTNLINATVFGDLNYRFNLYPNFWIEPTVGAQYTNTSYGTNAFQLGLADGTLVMVQGGARFGTNFLLCDWVRTTAILTGLAYDDVLVAGGFIPGAGFAGNNILAHADQGQVRGRGVLAFNFDFGQGISSFVQGEVRGGKGLFGAGGKAGVRYQW
jgi:Autotransporter beta-domain